MICIRTSTTCWLTIILIVKSFGVKEAWAFASKKPLERRLLSTPLPSRSTTGRVFESRTMRYSNSLLNANNNGNKKQTDGDLDNPIDKFLDTPFYDPDTVLDDPDSSLLEKKFAKFVKNDYYTAEGLLVGIFLVILVILSQEVLRIQLYSFENYVPFSRGTPFGRLF
jgi:hypothetical protein